MTTDPIQSASLIARDSTISGKGLFTTRDIHAGEPIFVVTGDVIDEIEALRREREEENWYIYWNHDEHYIDAAHSGLGRFVNHCCTPNAVTLPRDNSSVTLVALAEIAADSEVTIDYDYPEIYVACRRFNAHCFKTACPRVGDTI